MSIGHFPSSQPAPNGQMSLPGLLRAPVAPRPPRPPTRTSGRGLHTIVLTDVASSARYDPQGQRRMRREIHAMMCDVAHYAGLDLDALPVTDTGDGLRLFLPLTVVEPVRVVDMFVLGLVAQLREHRRTVNDTARIRMRVAFDLGLIEKHLLGWTGDPLIRVARLIDAQQIREALLADRRLDLAVIVSDALFEAVIRHGYGYLPPSYFEPVRVRVKEFDGRAWQLVRGAGGVCTCGEAA